MPSSFTDFFKLKFSKIVFQNGYRDIVSNKVSVSPLVHIKILTSTCSFGVWLIVILTGVKYLTGSTFYWSLLMLIFFFFIELLAIYNMYVYICMFALRFLVPESGSYYVVKPASNSWSICLRFLSAAIIGMCHHNWLLCFHKEIHLTGKKSISLVMAHSKTAEMNNLTEKKMDPTYVYRLFHVAA